jgi:dynein light intermediate chain 1
MAPSAYRDASTRTDHDRPSTSGSDKKELWSSLLDNVASGKRIPEKNLIVLGGTSETQKEFLDSLQQDAPNRLRPPDRSRSRKIPVANRFALGYTYQDVYDSDHEGWLPIPAAPVFVLVFIPKLI